MMNLLAKRYDSLLEKISRDFHVLKGPNEPEINWAGRIIYSLAARMGYVSLWDMQEDTRPASITHFKRRVKSIVQSGLKMYPEVRCLFLNGQNDEDVSANTHAYKNLEDELYDIFLSTGCLYHTTQRIVPCIPKAAKAGNLILTRGFSIDAPQNVSGAGTYVSESKENTFSLSDAESMFQIPGCTLEEQWERLTAERKWKTWSQAPDFLEFLKIKPPFTNGYWTHGIIDKTGEISLARIHDNALIIYFLYYYDSGKMYISELPHWMTDAHQYRNISNACLFHRKALPPAVYQTDGNTVFLQMGYLYPAAELNLLKLYSWPPIYTALPSDFNRIISRPVFEAIRILLERRGFQFKEEDLHVRRR